MRFEWDERKNQSNVRKHRIDFQTATAVFFDPLHATSYDGLVGVEERWSTVGLVGGRLLVTVAHTVEDEGFEMIRIISAREATPHERRDYEDSL